jgi:mono/diheme cytochrome c family protein
VTRRSTISAFATAAVLALSSVAFVQAGGDSQTPDPALVAKGEKIYNSFTGTQRCSLCHSIGDKGNKKGPLDGVGSKLSAEEIRQWLVNPKEMTTKTKSTRTPMMRPYDKLPKEDVDALVAYMLSLKKK